MDSRVTDVAHHTVETYYYFKYSMFGGNIFICYLICIPYCEITGKDHQYSPHTKILLPP